VNEKRLANRLVEEEKRKKVLTRFYERCLSASRRQLAVNLSKRPNLSQLTGSSGVITASSLPFQRLTELL
jgi:hypothetical protein